MTQAKLLKEEQDSDLFLARGDYDDAIEYFENYLEFDIPDEEKENVQKLIERVKAKI